MDAPQPIRVLDLSNTLTPYLGGWRLQRRILRDRLDFKRCSRNGITGGAPPPPDALLLMQHNHVYTLGRGADETHIKFTCDLSALARGRTPHPDTPRVIAPNGAEVFRVDRGGEVTYHGPGQLVAYPLVDLCRPHRSKDLRRYLHDIEDVVIRTLARYGVEGERDDANTGVWVRGRKLAAIGVGASRWVTTHGLAINVRPDMDFFDDSNIVPCGLNGREVTNLWAELEASGIGISCPCPQDVGKVVSEEFGAVFGVDMVQTVDEGEI